MIADRVRMRRKSRDKYVLAQDSDFSGTSNGQFVYIGSDEYIIIPKTIKGETVTTTNTGFGTAVRMFGGEASANVKGVATSEGHSITDMRNMFNGFKSETLELDFFDTTGVTTMFGMFNSCNVKELNLQSFNTSDVINMYGMFTKSSLTSLDLSSFNTSNVTNMQYMFSEIYATELDLSSFDTSKLGAGVNYMFYNSSNIRKVYARTEQDRVNMIAGKGVPTNTQIVVK